MGTYNLINTLDGLFDSLALGELKSPYNSFNYWIGPDRYQPKQKTGGYPQCSKEKLEDGAVCIKIAAPGAKKEDFNLELKDGLITVSCDPSDETILQKFSRVWRFEKELSLENIIAKYDSGILTLEVKKPVAVDEEILKIEVL